MNKYLRILGASVCLLVSPIAFQLSAASSSESSLDDAQKMISSAKKEDYAKGLKLLAHLAKDAKPELIKYKAIRLYSEELRKDKESDSLKDAIKLLTPYGDYSIVSGWKSSKDARGALYNPQLPLFLEFAHCRVLNKDNNEVRQGFKMLSYAEENCSGFDKCLVLSKYGEVLFGASENEKAEDYLSRALKLGEELSKALAAAATGNQDEHKNFLKEWNPLKAHIDKLRLLVADALLMEKYGEGYALYVRMNTFRDKKAYADAIETASSIIAKCPESVYADAAWLCRAKCRFEQGQDELAQKEMKTFISANPNGLYRGEAWMLLGQIALEKEWDAKKSSEHYAKALEYFRYARQRKDAIDLYAVSSKVAEVATPQKAPSSLDSWLSTIYTKSTPMEICNQKTSPWYLDENEKECLFMTGFFLFMENKFTEADEAFQQVKSLSKDIAFLEAKNLPNALMRLRGACKQGFMTARPCEMKVLTGKNRLRAMYGSLKYVLEKFDEGYKIFEDASNESKASDEEKAFGLLGMGLCLQMKMSIPTSQKAMEIYKSVFEKYPKTQAAADAFLNYAYLASYSGDKEVNKQANSLFFACYEKYPNSPYGEEALERLVINNRGKDNTLSLKYAKLYLEKYPKGLFIDLVSRFNKEMQEEGK